MFTSCTWAKPASPHPAAFCENGAKAAICDHTRTRCEPDFVAAHTVSDMRGWRDHALEAAGRLTLPMRHDAATDHYDPAGWAEAFAAIGDKLCEQQPASTSLCLGPGRSGDVETRAFFALVYDHNNLPDSSNMCHETTSVALKQKIGSAVGTRPDTVFRPEHRVQQSQFLDTIQAARKQG